MKTLVYFALLEINYNDLKSIFKLHKLHIVLQGHNTKILE